MSTDDGSTVSSARILVVDDDSAMRKTLCRALALEGYAVDSAADGAEAISYLDRGLPVDAVVLDVMMPNVDGITACRAIRRTSVVPILLLTARHGVDDRIEGLDAGADDYLGKPFAVGELLARLRALLRRTPPSGGRLAFADLVLDRNGRFGIRGSRRFQLSGTEFSLLELLLTHPRKVLPRSAIVAAVWGYDLEFASNSLEVYVGNLRRKTEADGESRLIHTVRGTGYVLRDGL